jgi:hypothetical protein
VLLFLKNLFDEFSQLGQLGEFFFRKWGKQK